MVEGYLVLKYVHVLAAAYLVGSIVTDYMFGRHARASRSVEVKRSAWEFLSRGEERVAIPLAGVLLVSGLLMVYGPWAGGWSLLEDRWTLWGLVLFFVLLAIMGGLGGAAAKAAWTAYAEGRADDAAPHERRYVGALAVGGVIAAFVVWLMVAKPF